MKTTEQFAWHISTTLHLLAFVAICCCAPAVLQSPLAQTRRGTIVLTASFTAEMLTHHAAHLHAHAPGLPQDHQHEHLPLAIHSHPPVTNSPEMNRPIEPRVAEVEMAIAATEPPVIARKTNSAAQAAPPPLAIAAHSDESRLARQHNAASVVASTTAVSAINIDAGANVDELPRQLPNNPPPPYPPDAYARRQQGRVLLEVQLDATGRPNAARVVESSGHRSLDDAACQAVLAWSFRPAYRNGEAVPFVIRVPVRFIIRE